MLRLINTPGVPGRRASRPGNTARSENPRLRPAAGVLTAEPLATSDARWVFAARVASQIEGGRAAILRPERRDRLMRTARALAIRPFDASVIIALVQDTARRGETPPGYPPLTPGLAEALRAVPGPERGAGSGQARVLGVATLAGALLAAAAALWVGW
jgi:hypothetical protein